MQNEELKQLFTVFLSGKGTKEEKIRLALYIDSLEDKALKDQLKIFWDNYESIHHLSEKKADQMLSRILSKASVLETPRRKPTITRRLYYQTASIVASLILLTGLTFYLTRTPESQEIVLEAKVSPPEEQVPHVRNITLPDGTLVVLQANSTLRLSDDFNTSGREVILSGEAYFDVEYDPENPFVIYSDKVKTTVLGTAFNIKAWPEESEVSVLVTRGKVEVEVSEKTTILSVNQEVKYNKKEDFSSMHIEEKAQKIVEDRIRQDLIFDGLTLENICRTLSQRYETKIIISGEELASTKVVASFSGTETLTNILDILCEISNSTRYKVSDNQVTIYSKQEF